MEKYSLEERVLIMQTYYENGRSVTETRRKLRGKFAPDHFPSESMVHRLMSKLETKGVLTDLPHPSGSRTVRTEENIALVASSVNNDPGTSIRRRSQELGISTTSIFKIMHCDLNLFPYKIQLTQVLQPSDHLERRKFADFVLERTQEDPDFVKKILFSDESHFHLQGYVNKQNCRIWATENPRQVLEVPLYSQKVTVWCAFWSGGVVGPFFFEDEEGNSVTVNGSRYRDMLANFLCPQLSVLPTNELYFQQDGATCHTAKETTAFLKSRFPGRLISIHGDVKWPPRSCDLTPLDFFLWGHLKDRVYKNQPKNLEQLKRNIKEVIEQLTPEICENVIRNFTKRINICKRLRGGHLNDILV